MLDAAVILIGREGSSASYGLPEESIELFLPAATGEGGLLRGRIQAKLVLTWQSEQALAAANTLAILNKFLGARRRAAVVWQKE